MLILDVMRNGSVVVFLPEGKQIVVTAVTTKADRVRLGFDAPKDIKILRGEIVGKPKKED